MAENVEVPFTSPGLDGIASGAEAAAAATAKLDAATANLSGQLSRLQSDYDSLENAAREASDPEQFIALRKAADNVAAAMKKVSKEIDAIDAARPATKAAAEEAAKLAEADKKAADAAKELEKAQKQAGKEAEKAAKDAAREQEKAAEKAKDLSKALAETSKRASDERGIAVATALGNLLAKAAEKAVELGVELAKALAVSVIEADRAKQSAIGLLRTYEGADKAAAHYEKLSGLAKKLGVDANNLTKDFVKFKEQGLTDADAVALIKLRADIEAIAPGTGKAEEATKRFFDQVKTGVGADNAIKQLADSYHVAGTGADAAAQKFKSPAAAIDSLKLKGTELAAKLADRLAPDIIKTADKFSAWLDKPETIAAIGKAADAVAASLEYVVPTIEVLTAALDSNSSASLGVAAAGGAVRGVVQALIAPFVGAYEAAVMVIDGFGRFSEVQQIVIGAVDGAITAVTGFVADWTQAGADLVAGFIAGIESGIDAAVAKAAELGSAATAEIKGILGIASPSKVFEEIGGNVSAGFEGGLEPVDVAAGLGVDEDPAIASGGGGGGTYEVTVNINIAGGAGGIDYAALELAARNAVMDALTGIGASSGTRTRGATT